MPAVTRTVTIMRCADLVTAIVEAGGFLDDRSGALWIVDATFDVASSGAFDLPVPQLAEGRYRCHLHSSDGIVVVNVRVPLAHAALAVAETAFAVDARLRAQSGNGDVVALVGERGAAGLAGLMDRTHPAVSPLAARLLSGQIAREADARLVSGPFASTPSASDHQTDTLACLLADAYRSADRVRGRAISDVEVLSKVLVSSGYLVAVADAVTRPSAR